MNACFFQEYSTQREGAGLSAMLRKRTGWFFPLFKECAYAPLGPTAPALCAQNFNRSNLRELI